ncbi:MAG TPA: hypothetical protein DCP28_35105 [Cytophagales bacterium]|nr:hypothetical protein [Cytophagales bacterium]
MDFQEFYSTLCSGIQKEAQSLVSDWPFREPKSRIQYKRVHKLSTTSPTFDFITENTLAATLRSVICYRLLVEWYGSEKFHRNLEFKPPKSTEKTPSGSAFKESVLNRTWDAKLSFRDLESLRYPTNELIYFLFQRGSKIGHSLETCKALLFFNHYAVGGTNQNVDIESLDAQAQVLKKRLHEEGRGIFEAEAENKQQASVITPPVIHSSQSTTAKFKSAGFGEPVGFIEKRSTLANEHHPTVIPDNNWSSYLNEGNKSSYYNSFGLEEWSKPGDETYFISGFEFHSDYTITMHYAYHTKDSPPSSEKISKAKAKVELGRYSQVHCHINETKFKAYFIFQAIGQESEEFFRFSYNSTEQTKGEPFSGVGVAIRVGASAFGKKISRPIIPPQRWLPNLTDFGMPEELETMLKGMGYPLMTGAQPKEITVPHLQLIENLEHSKNTLKQYLKGDYLVIGYDEETHGKNHSYFISHMYIRKDGSISYTYHAKSDGSLVRNAEVIPFHFTGTTFSIHLLDKSSKPYYMATGNMTLPEYDNVKAFSMTFTAIGETKYIPLVSVVFAFRIDKEFKGVPGYEALGRIPELTRKAEKVDLNGIPKKLLSFVKDKCKKPIKAPEVKYILDELNQALKDRKRNE